MVQFTATWKKSDFIAYEDNLQWGQCSEEIYKPQRTCYWGNSSFSEWHTKNVIMERSGHRSTDGVRQYESISQDQHIAAQAILTATDGSKAYDAEL